jgi:hypothetical protein
MKSRPMLFATVVAMVIALVMVLAASAANLIVKPSSMDGWGIQKVGTGTGGFDLGPGTPPLGAGSASLDVGADTNGLDRAAFRNTNYQGTLLADFTKIDYSTYVDQGNGCVAPLILLSVDVDGNGIYDPANTTDDGLFFEPCYQTGLYPTEPVGQSIPMQCDLGNPLCFTQDTWYHWDALNGGWWSSKYGGAGGPPLTLFSTYIQTLKAMGYTSPKIANTNNCLGGFRVQVGNGPPVWNDFQGNFDALTIGVSGTDTTYDFEYENKPIPGCATALTLTPETATNNVGTNHTVTATVTGDNSDPNGAPIPASGVSVNFTVTGTGSPNPASGSAFTDANGQATFTFTNSQSGTNTITATATGSGSSTLTDTASKTWVVPHFDAKISPTGTTCQQYAAGTAPTLSQVQYTTTKGGQINAVSPGVFFYYTKVSGTKNDTVGITQTHTGDAPTIPILNGQVVLYNASTCKVLKWTVTVNPDGTATGTLPSTGSFIIGVKYSPADLKGKQAPSPPTVTYSFGTTLNNVVIPADAATIDVVKK